MKISSFQKDVYLYAGIKANDANRRKWLYMTAQYLYRDKWDDDPTTAKGPHVFVRGGADVAPTSVHERLQAVLVRYGGLIACKCT